MHFFFSGRMATLANFAAVPRPCTLPRKQPYSYGCGMKRVGTLAAAILALAACKSEPNPYAAAREDQLHAKAQTLALPERYALYVEVWRPQIPRRPVLADDVALLGDTAWTYAMAQAVKGKTSELLQALPVLSAFHRTCTIEELNGLRAHVAKIAANDNREPMLEAVDGACQAGQPSGD